MVEPRREDLDLPLERLHPLCEPPDVRFQRGDIRLRLGEQRRVDFGWQTRYLAHRFSLLAFAPACLYPPLNDYLKTIADVIFGPYFVH